MEKPLKRHGKYFVYILQCQDGTYYTGYTTDLEKRIATHKNGKGAKYVRGKGPLKLVYAKEYRYKRNALKEEARIKTLSRDKKNEMIGRYREQH